MSTCRGVQCLFVFLAGVCFFRKRVTVSGRPIFAPMLRLLFPAFFFTSYFGDFQVCIEHGADHSKCYIRTVETFRKW